MTDHPQQWRITWRRAGWSRNTRTKVRLFSNEKRMRNWLDRLLKAPLTRITFLACDARYVGPWTRQWEWPEPGEQQ